MKEASPDFSQSMVAVRPNQITAFSQSMEAVRPNQITAFFRYGDNLHSTAGRLLLTNLHM